MSFWTKFFTHLVYLGFQNVLLIIQSACYLHIIAWGTFENGAAIHFGEHLDGPDYRREFGFCEIKAVKLEDEESGDETPSSTDDESEDEDWIVNMNGKNDHF